MSTVISGNSFTGWVPNKEPRQADGIAVLDGRNFIHDIEGPRSAFANKLWFSQGFDTTVVKRIYELRVGDEIFYGTPQGIWKFDAVSNLPYLILEITTQEPGWPWSVAYVGSKYYFSQYEIGLWEYDPSTGAIRHIVTPVYDGVRFVCASYGRLYVLSGAYIMWSAQDNGSVLEPTLATGAGAQALSILGGTALRVDPVIDGVIVATDRGLLKGTRVDEVYVSSWKILSVDVKLFSPNGACVVPDAGILYLDKHGLHLREASAGPLDPPVLWQEEWNAYFKASYLQVPQISLPGNLLMYYSQSEQLLFIGFNTTTAEGSFSDLYTLYTSTKKWGFFNYQNHGVFELISSTGEIRIGYLSTSNYIYRISNEQSCDAFLTQASDILPFSYSKPSASLLMQQVTDIDVDENGVPDLDINGNLVQTIVYSCIDEIWYSDFDPSCFDAGLPTGFYERVPTLYSDPLVVEQLPFSLAAGVYSAQTDLCFTDSGFEITKLTTYHFEQQDVGSSITIGPLRVISQQRQAPMELCSFDYLTVGTSFLGDIITAEDWDSAGTTEDWDTDAEDEDWGQVLPTTSNFRTTLEMTLDTKQVVDLGAELLFPMEQTDNSLTYSTRGIVGRYGLLTFDTAEPNDFIYLKTIEISGQANGYDA